MKNNQAESGYQTPALHAPPPPRLAAGESETD